MSSTYAGVDWASEKHDVVIADETGEEIVAATFAHDEAPRRSDLRVVVQAAKQRDHGRGAVGGDRRLPRALPHPRHPRRRRRPGRRGGRVRQTQDSLLPLGLQQAPAPGVRHARGHQPPPQPLGARPIRRRPRPRARPPPRDPHRRPWLVPDPMALLARPRPV